MRQDLIVASNMQTKGNNNVVAGCIIKDCVIEKGSVIYEKQ